MANFNYQKICQDILKNLTPRQREIMERRFGLVSPRRETLEEIGQRHNVCRERIRQIQNQAFSKLREGGAREERVFDHLRGLLEGWGGLKREDEILSQLGRGRFGNHIFFLLHLGEPFERRKEDKEFYTLWLMSEENLKLAKKVIAFLIKLLEKEASPLSFKELFSYSQKQLPPPELSPEILLSFLEATKRIEQGPREKFGLAFWPEITPRGVRDKAYLVLSEAKEPLHFTRVAEMIDQLPMTSQASPPRRTLPQTVHNELIKDERFVLVGRGLYGLREWGFEEGTVKEIIIKVFKEKKRPLSREEILEEVGRQRLVKANTILLNLKDRKYFQKNEEENYILK